MAKFSDLLSSAGFDTASVQSAMKGTTLPAAKPEGTPAQSAPAQSNFSHIPDEMARRLTDDTVVFLGNREMRTHATRQNLDGVEANVFNALANGIMTRNEFEAGMEALDVLRAGPTGLQSQEAALRTEQATVVRAVNAVVEASHSLGTEIPAIDITQRSGLLAEGGRMHTDAHTAGQRLARFSLETVDALSDAGLRFLARHEVAHTADPQLAIGHAAELRADAAAIRETCDIPAATQALATLAHLGQAPLTATATHPSLEARISNMQQVYDSECRRPSDTPAPQGGRVSARDRD